MVREIASIGCLPSSHVRNRVAIEQCTPLSSVPASVMNYSRNGQKTQMRASPAFFTGVSCLDRFRLAELMSQSKSIWIRMRVPSFSVLNTSSNVTTLDDLLGVDDAPPRDLLLPHFHYFRRKAATVQPQSYHAIRICLSMIPRSSPYAKPNCVTGTKTFPHRHCQVTVACDRILLASLYTFNACGLIPCLCCIELFLLA
jgi:hypothetical protein